MSRRKRVLKDEGNTTFVYWPVSTEEDYRYYIDWVEENLSGMFDVSAAGYHFEDKADAALFILTWGLVEWP